MDTTKDLIYLDDLTGLFNRRYLYFHLPKEIARAEAGKYNLWLFMLDIDNFKAINDIYGHLSGDEIIKQVSEVLKENTKAEDKKVRYAGDEFTVMLPNIESKDIIKIAERLVQKIESHRFKERFSGKELRVTISLGIAGYPHNTSEPIELINLADKALYISKQKGKNCVSSVAEITAELLWKKGLFERFPCSVLTGRIAELSILNEALKKAQTSQATFLLMDGELGCGKSRLLNEFEASLNKQELGVFFAKCMDKFSAQPYYILKELLEGHYEAALKDPDKESLGNILLKTIFNLSKDKTVCFIIDDLQYIDAESLKIINQLIVENIQSRILVVSAFSSGKLTIANIGDSALKVLLGAEEFQKHTQTMNLSNLDCEATKDMIMNILLNVPVNDKFIDTIYGRTKGNPLFVEELLKYLIENEFIYYKEGKWLQKELKADELPLSIEESIKKRIFNLDEETKAMIAKAAVIGDDFEVDFLQKIDSEDKGYILDLVEVAKKTGLIYEKGPKDKDEFSFVANEVRDVIIQALEEERKKKLYSRIGEIKEKLYTNRLGSVAGELYYDFKKAKNDERAEHYAKLLKERRNLLHDKTIKYAQSLLDQASLEKPILPLSPEAWQLVPDLIKCIYTAYINNMLYPAHNKMRVGSVEDVYEKISQLFTETEVLNISLVDSHIILNGKKVGKELTSFFINSFVTILSNMGVDSIIFYKGISQEELISFFEIISNKEIREKNNIAEFLNKEGVGHIQINEVSYEIAKKGFKEKDNLQEIMMIDYLLQDTALGTAGAGAVSPALILDHVQEIADGLQRLGEQEAKNTNSGSGKESAKAEAITNNLQRIGNQLLEKSQQWPEYKEGLTKVLLSLDPDLLADIFSLSPRQSEAKEVDILKELSSDFPDETILDILTKQYLHGESDITKMKKMLNRLLSTTEKKEKIVPALKDKLKKKGISEEECDWLFDESSWDSLSLDDKIKKITEFSVEKLQKLLPVINIKALFKELLSSGRGADIEMLEDRLIQLLSKDPKNYEKFTNIFREVIEILIELSKDKFLSEFIEKLLKVAKTNESLISAFGLIVGPSLDKITEIFLSSEKLSLLQEIIQLCVHDPVKIQVFSKTLDLVSLKLTDEFTRRADLNLPWKEIAEILILLRDKAVKCLLDKALFKTGIPEGKYFEAYLRRRLIGKILSKMPAESITKVFTKEKINEAPSYIIKNIIEIIGVIENEQVIKILEVPLMHPDTTIRQKAIFILGKLKDKESALLLAKSATGDENPDLRKKALLSLEARTDQFAKEALRKISGGKEK